MTISGPQSEVRVISMITYNVQIHSLHGNHNMPFVFSWFDFKITCMHFYTFFMRYFPYDGENSAGLARAMERTIHLSRIWFVDIDEDQKIIL
jgi:hypothetical protein